MMARWVKFNAAGMLGVVVQLALLYALTRFAGFNYLFATGFAVEAAILHNFLWHERYTWRLRTEKDAARSLRRLAYFNLSNGGVSLLGNVLLMKWLVETMAAPVLIANLCAIAACSTLNFLVAEYLVFAPKREVNDGGLFV